MRLRRFALPVLLLAALTVGAGTSVGCSGNPPPVLTQLSPEGLRAYNNYKYVRLVNDVTSGVIAGARAKQIPQAAEVQYLTVAKQVLDVFEADPRGAREKALTIVRNTRDGLPAAINASIGAFLTEVEMILAEVQRG